MIRKKPKKRQPRLKKGGTLRQPSVSSKLAAHPVLHYLSLPVFFIVEYAFQAYPKHKNIGRAGVGGALMITGSYLSYTVAHTFAAPACFLIDAAAWGLHGFGLAPILKVAAEKLKLDI